MRTRTNFYLDKRRALSDGSHPLSLVIRHGGKVAYIRTGISLMEHQWSVESSSAKASTRAARIVRTMMRQLVNGDRYFMIVDPLLVSKS